MRHHRTEPAQLARDVHVSSSSLSRYFSGQAVPPWPTVVALGKAAGHDPQDDAARGVGAGRGRAPDQPGCPGAGAQ
ncbi:helix-turn-helix domain-containing protein [Streptomyces sp. A475]|uniref:helix-turn-helix domain-containing protein n=1 Tax=Streptomyces sp. A475 TaxID=3131976 RepID=UPI0030CA11AD